MNYEIVLVCPFCDVERRLGSIQAESALEAKHAAAVRWPDARYEEMVARGSKSECVPVPDGARYVHPRLFE